MGPANDEGGGENDENKARIEMQRARHTGPAAVIQSQFSLIYQLAAHNERHLSKDQRAWR